MGNRVHLNLLRTDVTHARIRISGRRKRSWAGNLAHWLVCTLRERTGGSSITGSPRKVNVEQCEIIQTRLEVADSTVATCANVPQMHLLLLLAFTTSHLDSLHGALNMCYSYGDRLKSFMGLLFIHKRLSQPSHLTHSTRAS